MNARFGPAACAAAAILSLAAGGATSAQMMDHGAMDHGAMTMPGGEEHPSSRAYRDANVAMHGAMDIPLTGNADVDFIRSMIPHHEGAVAMARIVLEHGSDAEVRKLAEDVIAAQKAEIDWMHAWLARNAE